MQPLTIDEMKLIELDIASEIDRVCRKLGITYYLAYGTLLGAVRHGGFIPWDDDMDLIMMRDDYERFLREYAANASTPSYKLVSYRDGSSPAAFAKVVDTTTYVEERYSRECYGSGVWVDIFPYDAVDPQDHAMFSKVKRLMAMRYLIVTDPSTGSSAPVLLAKRIVCPLLRALDPCAYARRIDEVAMASNRACAPARQSSADTGFVADIVAEGSPERCYPRHLFSPVELSFEGRTFLAPAGFEELLDIAYGDWRTLPPESEREPHTCRAYRLDDAHGEDERAWR